MSMFGKSEEGSFLLIKKGAGKYIANTCKRTLNSIPVLYIYKKCFYKERHPSVLTAAWIFFALSM